MKSIEHWTENPDLVDRYILNKFSKQKKDALDIHLLTCDSCKIKIDQMNSMQLVVRENARQELLNDLTIKLIIAKKDFNSGRKKSISHRAKSAIIGTFIISIAVFLLTQVFNFTPLAIVADGQKGKYSGTTSKVTTDQEIKEEQYTKDIIGSELPEQNDSTSFIKSTIEKPSSIKSDTLNKSDEKRYENLTKVNLNKNSFLSKKVDEVSSELIKTKIKLSLIPTESKLENTKTIQAKFIRPDASFKATLFLIYDG